MELDACGDLIIGFLDKISTADFFRSGWQNRIFNIIIAGRFDSAAAVSQVSIMQRFYGNAI